MSTGGEHRFVREARLSGRLEHPSIISVHDLGQHPDGELYHTMRYIEGDALESKLEPCRTLSQRLHYLPNFRDVCNAIAFAHSHQILHRDLKPANIVLGSFGETVVVDWGLAKALDDPELDEPPSEEAPIGCWPGTSVGTRLR